MSPLSPSSTDLVVAQRRHLGMSSSRLAEIEMQSRCTLQAAERARAPITCLGPSIVSARPRLYPAATSDWVLTPLGHDPLYRNGRFPIPRDARRHLSRLRAAKIHFDEIVVAHEITKDLTQTNLPGPVADAPVDLTPDDLTGLILHPGAAHSTQAVGASAGALAGLVGRAALRTCEGISRGARVAGRGAAATLETSAKVSAGIMAVAQTSLRRLDPVIFGIERIEDAEGAGIVYELIRWDW